MSFYRNLNVDDINSLDVDVKAYHNRLMTYTINGDDIKWEHSGAPVHTMENKAWEELRANAGAENLPAGYNVIRLFEDVQTLHVAADDMEIAADSIVATSRVLCSKSGIMPDDTTIDGVKAMASAAADAFYHAKLILRMAELADTMASVDENLYHTSFCVVKEGSEKEAIKAMRGLYLAARSVLIAASIDDACIIKAVINVTAKRAEETRHAIRKVSAELAASFAEAAADYVAGLEYAAYHIF